MYSVSRPNPVQLTSEAVNELLAIESKPLFNQRLSELVVTNSEKRMIAIMCTNHALYPDVNIDVHHPTTCCN